MTHGNDGSPEVIDVLLSGTVFYDMIFGGLSRIPQPGEELWSKAFAVSPGGIANLAVACARLGLTTSLVAGFGDDAYASQIRHQLSNVEGIDISHSPVCAGYPTPITVAMSTDGDRAMVTYGEEFPEDLEGSIAKVASARAALVDLARDTEWWSERLCDGTRMWADIGFDPTEKWDVSDLEPLAACHAFTPNAVEAMAYTRTDSPKKAARALAQRVPLVIVTDGAHGSYAIDQSTGEEAFCPALDVNAVDPTGAGDVFAAASVAGDLRDWPLEQRLRFASLCAALSVQRFGGALAAPNWSDLEQWWHGVRERDRDLAARYSFLAEELGWAL